MKLVLELDFVDEFTSGFRSEVQHGRAVIGRGAATANHRRRCFSVVPQKPSAWGNPPLEEYGFTSDLP
jgi:hypothetical protein